MERGIGKFPVIFVHKAEALVLLDSGWPRMTVQIQTLQCSLELISCDLKVIESVKSEEETVFGCPCVKQKSCFECVLQWSRGKRWSLLCCSHDKRWNFTCFESLFNFIFACDVTTWEINRIGWIQHYSKSHRSKWKRADVNKLDSLQNFKATDVLKLVCEVGRFFFVNWTDRQRDFSRHWSCEIFWDL